MIETTIPLSLRSIGDKYSSLKSPIDLIALLQAKELAEIRLGIEDEGQHIILFAYPEEEIPSLWDCLTVNGTLLLRFVLQLSKTVKAAKPQSEALLEYKVTLISPEPALTCSKKMRLREAYGRKSKCRL